MFSKLSDPKFIVPVVIIFIALNFAAKKVPALSGVLG